MRSLFFILPSLDLFYALIRVGRVKGAVDILISIGFRENEGGLLVLPLGVDHSELLARKVELEVGIDIIKSRQAFLKDSATSDRSQPIEQPDTRMIMEEKTKKGASSSSLPVQPQSRVKYDAAVQELAMTEKIKRQKAETIVAQQKAMLTELQAQLSDLREKESLKLHLQYSRTIAEFDGTSLGPQPLVENERTDISGSASQRTKTSRPNSRSDPRQQRASPAENTMNVQTQLSNPAKKGELKVNVQSQKEFKKGMLLLIGSGASLESARVVGFGSIVLSTPLLFDHPEETIVRGFKYTAQNVRMVERQLINAYISCQIFQEVISNAVQIAEDTRIKSLIDLEYQKRLVLKHGYAIQRFEDIAPFDNICGPVIVSSLTGSLISLVNGKIYGWSAKITYVDMILLFCSCIDTANPSTFNVLDIPESVHKEDMLHLFDGDTAFSNIFQGLVGLYANAGIKTIPELLSLFDSKGVITWASYFSCVTRREWKGKDRVKSEDFEYVENNDVGLDLVYKLFEMMDCDQDDTLLEAEAKAAFSALDGVAPDEDLFEDILTTIVGHRVDSCKLTIHSFVRIREKYASKKRTLFGGVHLEGNILLRRAYIHLDLKEQSSSPTSRHPRDLVPCLSMSVTQKLHVRTGKSVFEILSEAERCYSVYDISLLFNQRCVAVNVPLTEHVFKTRRRLEIYKMCLDYTGNTLFALCTDGMVHAFDIQSGDEVFERRVMWNESVPTSFLEGIEKFFSWRKERGLDVDEQTQYVKFNSIECKRTSALLSKYSHRIFSRIGSSGVLSVDHNSGLVAVDCSIISGSICFYEPISMRRLYRIKSPCKLSVDVDNTVRMISNGEQGVPDTSAMPEKALNGLILAMKVLSGRSLLICLQNGSHSLIVLSMLTGEVLKDILGHSSSISCLTVESQSGALFSGSVDGSIRLWRLDDVIPRNTATLIDSAHISTNPSLATAENRISRVHENRFDASLVRHLFTRICNAISIRPQWMLGKVIGLYDGRRLLPAGAEMQVNYQVEVVLENSTVMIVSNCIALRDPSEMQTNPEGPPRWKENPAVVAIGNSVALHIIDLEWMNILVCRAFSVPADLLLTVDDLAMRIAAMLHSSDLSDQKVSDVLAILDMIGYGEEDRISVGSFLRRLRRKAEEVHDSLCDRYLNGHRAAVSSIALTATSKLLISIDKRYLSFPLVI